MFQDFVHPQYGSVSFVQGSRLPAKAHRKKSPTPYWESSLVVAMFKAAFVNTQVPANAARSAAPKRRIRQSLLCFFLSCARALLCVCVCRKIKSMRSQQTPLPQRLSFVCARDGALGPFDSVLLLQRMARRLWPLGPPKSLRPAQPFWLHGLWKGTLRRFDHTVRALEGQLQTGAGHSLVHTRFNQYLSKLFSAQVGST